MATHSSILAWKIPWADEPDGLQSMASQSQAQLSDYTHIRGFVYKFLRASKTWVSLKDYISEWN